MLNRLTTMLFLSVVGITNQSSISHSVSRRCNDTIYSRYEKEGIITSPSFPRRYQPYTKCSFTFRGSRHERVQIIFTEFNLKEPPAHLQPHERCLHTDWVAVYNMINDSKRQEIDRFCGIAVPNSVMTATSALQLVFKGTTGISLNEDPNSRLGFSARFKFVSGNEIFQEKVSFLQSLDDKNLGIPSGTQSTEGKCQFTYKSSEAPNGTVYSPNPGGFYPLDTTCVYLFYGEPGEIVRIIFKYFDVEGVLPCNSDSDSDYIKFSNFPSADRKIPTFCGYMAPRVIHSDSSYFRMIFRSNGKFGGTGFAADYQFLDNTRHPYAIKRVIGAAFVGEGTRQNQDNFWVTLFTATVFAFRYIH